jgi:hypothetical protein
VEFVQVKVADSAELAASMAAQASSLTAFEPI